MFHRSNLLLNFFLCANVNINLFQNIFITESLIIDFLFVTFKNPILFFSSKKKKITIYNVKIILVCINVQIKTMLQLILCRKYEIRYTIKKSRNTIDQK